MNGVSKCAVLMIALAVLAQPVLARTHLNCAARKVVLTSAPSVLYVMAISARFRSSK
jgi:hypothetical protein